MNGAKKARDGGNRSETMRLTQNFVIVVVAGWCVLLSGCGGKPASSRPATQASPPGQNLQIGSTQAPATKESSGGSENTTNGSVGNSESTRGPSELLPPPTGGF